MQSLSLLNSLYHSPGGQIADDADLDQAGRALKTAQAFFKKIVDAAAATELEPYDLLVPKGKGHGSANISDNSHYASARNRVLGRTVATSL